MTADLYKAWHVHDSVNREDIVAGRSKMEVLEEKEGSAAYPQPICQDGQGDHLVLRHLSQQLVVCALHRATDFSTRLGFPRPFTTLLPLSSIGGRFYIYELLI